MILKCISKGKKMQYCKMDAILYETLNAKQDVKVDVTPNAKLDANIRPKY